MMFIDGGEESERERVIVSWPRAAPFGVTPLVLCQASSTLKLLLADIVAFSNSAFIEIFYLILILWPENNDDPGLRKIDWQYYSFESENMILA